MVTLKDVVCGIVERDQKILVALRPLKSSSSGYWEFPGGKVEEGETHQEALQREFSEELGVTDVQVGQLILEQVLHRGEGPYKLFAYAIESFSGEPKNHWHERLFWCPKSSLSQLPLLPSNVIILEKAL